MRGNSCRLGIGKYVSGIFWNLFPESKNIRGFSFNQFEEDEKTVDSVLRNLEIIGEASRHIPKDIKTRYPDLPRLEMNTMRNIVIHEYHGVSLKIIWTTIKNDLPPLVPRLKEILAQED